ncbi:hypothetical protein V8F33_012109 [Rhypophila sp. PSN 637]
MNIEPEKFHLELAVISSWQNIVSYNGGVAPLFRGHGNQGEICARPASTLDHTNHNPPLFNHTTDHPPRYTCTKMPLDLDEFITELTAGREKGKECTPYIRVAMCALVASGALSEKAVARKFRVSDATVRHTIRHWKAHKNFDSSKRSGRPRKDAKGKGGDSSNAGDADADGEIQQLDERDTTMYDTTAAEMTIPETSEIPETSTPTSEAAREASIQNIMNQEPSVLSSGLSNVSAFAVEDLRHPFHVGA